MVFLHIRYAQVIRYLLLLLCVCMSNILQAQPLQFRHLTVNDGLTQNSASAMVFDRQGRLWVGTADGLNRYDGYSFTHYRKSGIREKRLFNTGINDLACDANGVIWIIGSDGLEVLDPATGMQRTLMSLPLNANMARYWYDSAGQRMLCFLKDRGVIAYDIHNYTSTDLTTPAADAFSSKLASLSIIPAPEHGLLYLIPRGTNTIITLDIRNGHHSEHAVTDGKDDLITSYPAPYGNGHLVFTAYQQRQYLIVEYDPLLKRTVRKAVAVQRANDPFFKAVFYLPSLQRFLVSDYDRGLIFYDTAFRETASYPVSTVLSGNVHGMITRCMLLQNDCLWLGSDPNGITWCDLSPQLFRLYRNNGNSQLPVVKGIFTDSHENVFSCYLTSGADVFDRNGNYLRDLEPIGGKGNEPLALQAFNSFIPAGRDSVFIYCQNFFGFYEPLSGHHTNYLDQLQAASPNNRLMENTFHQVATAGPRRFLCSYGRYIWLADLSKSGMQLTLKDSLDRQVSALFMNKDGSFLAGCETGLYRIMAGEKKFIPETGNVLIKQISVDPAGDHWISTVDGLWRLGEDGKVKQHYTTDNGMPNNYTYGSIVSGDHVWVSTNDGLSRISMNGGQILNYSMNDGLQSNEFNSGALWKADNGKIYFGGVNGISMIDEQIPATTAPVFPVLVNRILVNETEVPAVNNAGAVQLELDHQQNNIVFQFAGIFLPKSRMIRYRYKLEGADKDWVYPASERSVRYAGLAPGTYTFRVAASLQPGDWRNETLVRVTIRPPFWMTFWFRAGMIVLSILLIWFIIRKMNERKYNRQLATIRMQQQLEEERKRISRDLHDNIGAYTSALMANVERMKLKSGDDADLTRMQGNAEQILSSLRETIWVLNNKEISIADFSDGFKNHCSKLLRNFEQIGLQVQEEISENRILSASQAIHLNKILQEAVQNAIRHSGATQIVFRVKSADQLLLILEDNGHGFDESQVKKGNGLENMQWRAREAGVNLRVETHPGQGTRIILEK